jgi:hypothetical protein
MEWMKSNRFGNWRVIGLGCFLLPALAFAADSAPAPKIGVSMDYVGKYIWRGQNLQDDGAFQPAVSLTYGGLTGTIWGSLDLSNHNDNAGEITEVDYSLDYTSAIPGLEFLSGSVGVIHYDFPNTRFDDTTEIYAGLTLSAPLNPSIKIYRDVQEADATYLSFGLSHSIEKIAELAADVPVGLTLAAAIGWGNNDYNRYYWGRNANAVNDLSFKVGFPIAIAGWTLTPNLNYVTLLDSDIRNSDAYDTASDYFFAGVSLSRQF